MLKRVQVIGRGRAGSAIAGRLSARGLLAERDPDLVLLCVPDSVIAEVAGKVSTGPWVAHVSGATRLTALDPHVRRFGVHPLQTLVRSRGPEQLDGAWGAVTAESAEARSCGHWLADQLGLKAFDLADDQRALYHCGAAIASGFLVTLHYAAAQALAAAGAPPEALIPLMRRTIENNFELTGPVARGDWSTVEAHLNALRLRLPDLEPLYRSLLEATPR